MTKEAGASERRYYITTAIDYPNAPPHIGHALEKIAADIAARYRRLQGYDTLFSMGVDENSQHVARAALANGSDPRSWTQRMDAAFRLAWRKLQLSNDAWIRTTEKRHARASAEMFRRAQQNGDIYRATYSGWYCPNCNAFYTTEELVAGRCPDHPSVEPEWLEEENYFFALTKYSERLLAHIQAHPEFIVPANRRAEALGLLRQGLRDFSVSRLLRPETPAWGIPVPGDPRQALYVWFDALTNYLTVAGFPDEPERFARYWPADVHVIGKDVLRFHCLYWPAMLLSAGLPLPRQIAIHGFVTVEGARISKSAGNAIDPVALVDEFGVDAVRYYLARSLSFASDGDFSRAGLLRHYNAELANDLGNLLNRVVTLVQRYRGGSIPPPGAPGERETELQRAAEETRRQAGREIERWEISKALETIWSLVRRANGYIEQSRPWELARAEGRQQLLDTVLYTAAEVTRLLAVLLEPFIPQASARMLQQLAQEAANEQALIGADLWGSRPLTRVIPGELLFPRIQI